MARELRQHGAAVMTLDEPDAVAQALAAKEAYDFLGTPEGELAIAQAVVYLASAPKSNAVYAAFGEAKRAADEHGSLTPPAHILNAPTTMMKNLGYGAGYEYDHDSAEAFSGQNYFPDGMPEVSWYNPTTRGLEGRWRQCRSRDEEPP